MFGARRHRIKAASKAWPAALYTVVMAANRDFADYCCELLSSVGPCIAKRMFGGWGLSLDGLTFAIIADLGEGEKLWLKADSQTEHRFEAQGGKRFTMTMQRKDGPAQVSMGYYSVPVDAMESALVMAPWARLALGTALQAHSLKTRRKPPTRRKSNKPPGA